MWQWEIREPYARMEIDINYKVPGKCGNKIRVGEPKRDGCKDHLSCTKPHGTGERTVFKGATKGKHSKRVWPWRWSRSRGVAAATAQCALYVKASRLKGVCWQGTMCEWFQPVV